MRTAILTSLVAALACGSLPAQGKIQDVLLTNDGRRVRGVEITEMTSSAVKYTKGGTENEVPANQVADIRWHEPPESYASALGALRQGDLQTAANLFTEAATETKRPVFATEAKFRALEALVRATTNEPDKAALTVDSVNAWLAESPNGFRLPDVTMLLGRAQLASGNPAAARATFKGLADSALSQNWAPIWGARAKFEQARAMVAAGDHANARTTFRSAISAAQAAAGDAADPEVVALEAEASVGVGELMIQEQKFDDALTYFRDLANRASSDSVRAAARAGEGEALFLQAKNAGNQDSLRAAQIALARANLLDATGGATTAKSLYYSGMVLMALGADREASNFKQRAAEYFQSVVRHYPDAKWAPLAAEAQRQ